MKSIRIGNDIRIEWPMVLSGDVEKLKDLDLTVEVRPSAKIIDTHNYADENSRKEVTVMMNGGLGCLPDIGDGKEHCKPCGTRPHCPTAPVLLPYHIEDNTLIAMWTADRQFAVGDYDIIVYAHKNGGGQAVADTYRFVRLVPHTAQADGPDNSGIEAVITMQPLTLCLSGLSAYEVAVVNGFQGSVEEWLESLKAGKLSSYVSVESIDNLPKQGDESTGYIIGTKLYIYVGTGGDTLEGKYKDVGEFRGPQGAPGSNGKSAYELAVEGGYEGSVEEWLLSLKGRDGVDGVNGADGLDGENGKDGVTPLIRWNNNRIEQSTDNGKSWWALSDKFNNKLYIKGYETSVDKLPKNALVGDMYGVGPIYGDDDVEQTKPYYQVYVNTVTDWAKSATITKVYQSDTELPQSAENNEIILIKKSTDNYLVYKYVNGSWNLLANLAEIYVEKDDIVNRGDNIFALVQSEIENQYELYERVVSWRNSGTFTSITAGIVNELGDSENAVMSQKAVTDAILNKIDLSEIDFDSGTLVKLAMCQVPTRFNVVKNNKSCGTMEVFSDDMGHMVTEVFETHYTLVDGELGTAHSDDKIFRYMRSYHISGGTSDIPVGTWGEWKQVYASDNNDRLTEVEASSENLSKNVGLDEYETFSDQKAYSAGDTVMYNGLLYTFTTDHVAGAWNKNEVENENLNKKIEKNYLNIISDGTYNKGSNIAFAKSNFFRYGYYNSDNGFTVGNDDYGWSYEWNLVYIPIIANVTYKVYTTSKPNSDVCRIIFLDKNFTVLRKEDYSKGVEKEVTSKLNEAYMAVYFSFDMRVIPTKSYVIEGYYHNIREKINKLETTDTTILKLLSDSLRKYIPIAAYYHKNNNCVLNTFNFSRFGFYPSKDKGTSFVFASDDYNWGEDWSIVFIPVETGVVYTVTNASGADNNRYIVMTDINLKVTHGILNTETQIIAESGDTYLAVQFGANVQSSKSYYIEYNPQLLIHKVQEFYKFLEKYNFNVISGDNLIETNFVEKVIGYYSNNGEFISTVDSQYGGDNWWTFIIPIKRNTEYKWSSYYGVPNANHAILDANKKAIQLLHISAPSDFRNEQTLNTDLENAAYFALQIQNTGDNLKSTYFKSSVDYDVDNIENSFNNLNARLSKLELPESHYKDFSTIKIPYIFGMVNSNLYSREYVVRLFPESFLDVKPKSPVTVNYRRDVALSRQRKTTTPYEKVVKNILLQANGYKDKTISLDFHLMNENVFANKNIRLILFGVSFDSIDYKNIEGSFEEGGTMTSALLEKYIRMSAKDNDYSVNYVSIGTLGHGNGDTFRYNGESLPCRGKHEARGGNNGVCYLRQPMNFSPTDISYDPNVSGTSATGLIQWFMNGLRYRVPYNQEYTTTGNDYGVFEKTVDKLNALRYTPFGKYHHDYAEELWEFCNKKGWITKVSGTYSSWTGSDEQKQIIDNCMDYVAENPDYPFYDRDTARETSYIDGIAKDVTDKTQYAINYNKYLERYRTMDDLGIRLSIGDENPAGKSVEGSDSTTYTVGSKITSQSLLNYYDVCKPTHIIWDMMYNDWGYYGSGDTGNSDGTDALEMTELFISAMKKQLGEDIIFGIKAKKSNGSFYPDVWSDICLGQPYSPTGSLINYNKLAISKYSDLSQKINWIPIFPASLPFASNYSQKFEDFVYNSIIVNSGDTYSSTSDVTHEGLMSAKSMTYQIYGWLAYTIKDN